jgi:acetyltransferase-like isoleucine patch superfamily enzyme
MSRPDAELTPEHLYASLRALYADREGDARERWQRSLPFADHIVDRWERARALGFGEGSSIYDQSLVLGDVEVGTKTWIGPGTVLDGSGGLRIGATCSISAGVQIYSHDSVRWALSGGEAPYERAPVAIGDHCYIGPCSIVTKGVTIGHHCVVGAHSLVNRDLPDYAIAFGVPCRIVGQVQLVDGTINLVYADAP